ncbi:MAG: VOC family protein [Burkholderiaceae bacterium]
MLRSEPDHLVVACADLDQGSAWAVRALGAEPQPGGRHATMGTHNRLLKLGPRVYLELLAIDPRAAAPAHPRWFSLDDPAVQARAARAPFLLTWVASTTDIVEAVTRVPMLGEPRAFTRNAYAWRLAVTEGGALPFGGVLPSAIEWSGAHPCDALEERGCALVELCLSHPAAAGVLPLFRELRIAGPVQLRPGPKSLCAVLRTPRGMVELRDA